MLCFSAVQSIQHTSFQRFHHGVYHDGVGVKSIVNVIFQSAG